MRVSIVLFMALFVTGCTFGTPVYTKYNSNGAFILTQKYSKDILCVKDAGFVHSNKLRCYYVSDTGKNKNGAWSTGSTTGSL